MAVLVLIAALFGYQMEGSPAGDRWFETLQIAAPLQKS
jgi:hypothetical protein